MRETLLSFCLLLFSNLLLGQFGPQQVISDELIRPYIAKPFDIDNDGYIDIFSAHLENYLIKWNRNLDGNGNFGEDIIISEESAYYLSFYFVDLDTDGDNDLLFLENNPNIVGWFENLDGAGNFNESQTIISFSGDYVRSVETIDIDNDDDLDLVVTVTDTFFEWMTYYENIDGNGNFEESEILIGSELISSIHPPLFVDIDNDGFLDMLTAYENSGGPGKLVWYKNLGNGSFDEELEIYQFEYIQSDWTSIGGIQFVDINSDSKKDIVLTAHHDDFGTFFYWIQNIDSQGTFGDLQNLPKYRIFFDVENDGDNDIIYSDRFENRIYWIENSDGLGTFTTERTISTDIDFLRDLSYTDINGDGIMDLISASLLDDKVAWYPNSGILGFSENSIQTISLFPNPVNDKIFINTKESINNVIIYNALGMEVLKVSNSSQLNVEQLPQGIYLLKMLISDGSVISEKIIKF